MKRYMPLVHIFCPVKTKTKIRLRRKKILHSTARDHLGRSRWKTLPKLRAASAMRRKVVVKILKRCLQRQKEETNMRVSTSWILGINVDFVSVGNRSSDAVKWKKACDWEMASLHKNNT